MEAPRGKSLREHVYNQLKHDILAGRLRPLERLLEPQLASQLQVSRTPVREALQKLAAEGLVRIDRQVGVTVADANWDDLEEIYAVRAVLEGLAARLLAGRLGVADLREFEENIRLCAELEAKQDYPELSQASGHFHWMIVEKCGNRQLMEVDRRLLDWCTRFRALTRFFQLRAGHLTSDHEEILEVLKAGDPLAAEELVRAHLDKAYQVFRQERSLEREQRTGSGSTRR